jgi:hypothetical protein
LAGAQVWRPGGGGQDSPVGGPKFPVAFFLAFCSFFFFAQVSRPMPGGPGKRHPEQSPFLSCSESTFMVLCFQRNNRAVFVCSRFLVFEVLKIKIQIVLLQSSWKGETKENPNLQLCPFLGFFRCIPEKEKEDRITSLWIYYENPKPPKKQK